MAETIVLGAGMVGVTTALALQDRGQSVLLVDRRAPGQETSFGNAGIIQTEAVEPYGMPRALGDLVAAARGRGNQVSYRLADLAQWAGPVLQYWHQSAPARHQAISARYARLVRRAGEDHAALIQAAGAEGLIARQGLRELYRDPAGFEGAQRHAADIRARYGVDYRVESGDQVAQAEPDLITGVAGAILWTEPMACADPGGLVAAYADLFRRRGGQIALGDAQSLQAREGGWQVMTADGPQQAEDVVIALGPWAPSVLRRFGYSIPQVIKRGYHQHFNGKGPKTPLVDVANGTVISPMRAGIRVLTGAELAGLDRSPRYDQLNRSIAAGRSLFDLGQAVEETPWHGARPCLPRMLPMVAQAPKHQGLWFNFGHGHQGFTLGPTTAQLLAEAMYGRAEDMDLMQALSMRGL